jgi:hypothetical protein
MYMYEAPTIFWALWKAVSPFIDPETKQKVRFVTAKEAAQEFSEPFGEVRCPHALLLRQGGTCMRCLTSEHAVLQLLPTELGGSAPWIPVEDAIVKFNVYPSAKVA